MSDKVKYLEKQNYVPLSMGHQAKLWNQDQLFKKLSVQNPWDMLVHFPHVWKGKTETWVGGALIQGYNVSTLHWKFKITSKRPPASKWVTVTQGAKHWTNRRRDISLCNIISSKNSWGFKRETSFLLSFCRCRPGYGVTIVQSFTWNNSPRLFLKRCGG